MKKQVRCVCYLPRRLYHVIEDIMPLFLDLESSNPSYGAFSKAVEYIIQEYMFSDDYAKKIEQVKQLRWTAILEFSNKEKELRKSTKS